MTEPMFPHQAEAARRIAAGVPTYLGFDMGIGKSRTFIEATKLGLEAAKAKRVLILCPASAVLVWKREITLWDPGATFVVVRKPADLVTGAKYLIVSHGLLSQKHGLVAAALLLSPRFDMTAIDEAHAFNAADSLRVKALRRAVPKLGCIVPLSGTPMRNHAGDLYTLLSLCWPQGLKGMNRYDFEELFCRVSTRNFGHGRVRVIDGSKNLPKLREMIAPFMRRVRKEDVLTTLPPILWDVVPVALNANMMPPEDQELLRKIIEDTINETKDLQEALALRHGSGAHLMALRRRLGLAKLKGSIEYITDMLDNLPEDRKLLVFGIHADVISALVHALPGFEPAVITGQTSPRERETAVSKFLKKKQCRVFVGNIQAAGTALTLVGPTCKCSDIVFVESAWTAADNAQAACRIHRIGQHDGVVARMLSANGTIDDLIQAILVRKAREFTQLFDQQKGPTHEALF